MILKAADEIIMILTKEKTRHLKKRDPNWKNNSTEATYLRILWPEQYWPPFRWRYFKCISLNEAVEIWLPVTGRFGSNYGLASSSASSQAQNSIEWPDSCLAADVIIIKLMHRLRYILNHSFPGYQFEWRHVVTKDKWHIMIGKESPEITCLKKKQDIQRFPLFLDLTCIMLLSAPYLSMA